MSIDRVLIMAELEFLKVLVPRLPQNSSSVNTECVGKSKQLYSLCDQLLGAMIYLHFITLILFLTTEFFKNTSNWSKLVKHLSTLFLLSSLITFQNFFR